MSQTIQLPNEGTVRVAIDSAIDKLISRDGILLKLDVNERSITHRLAIYLEEELPDWDVDCEYNRNRDDPKRLPIKREPIQSDDLLAATVYPDIVVHRRNSSDNLLAVEVKKDSSNRSEEIDRHKLKLFKRELNYRFVALLRIPTGEKIGPIIFEFL